LGDEKEMDHFRTLVADGPTFCWQRMNPKDDLETALGVDQFDLIIANYLDANTDVLRAVELLRQRQPKAQIILLCRKLELPEIIRAIRLGVRDVFNPPLDSRMIAGRIEALVRSGKKPDEREGSALVRLMSRVFRWK